MRSAGIADALQGVGVSCLVVDNPESAPSPVCEWSKAGTKETVDPDLAEIPANNPRPAGFTGSSSMRRKNPLTERIV